MRFLPSLVLLAATSAIAADAPKLPAIPEQPIAVKKELLFSDDFQGATPAAVWHKVVPTFAVEGGVLKGTQTRDVTIPAADGKPEVKAHAAVHGLEIPTKDSIVEVKIKFEGATAIDVEFDDRKYTASHYGHLCRAIVRPNGVTILDEREGTQNMVLKEMANDPTKKEERAKRLAPTMATFPAQFEKGVWYQMVVETAGDSMRVSIDGKAVAFLKSPGIGHLTKSKIELGVTGKDGFFDDIKVWNAEPVR